jgi:hypothetical protein
VSIDFAYAQARLQARLGERLSEAGWRVLESTLSLPQYLASARSTALSRRVHHFSADVTTHAIERALRDDWRAEVFAVSHWVPEPWSPAVAWCAWLPYLDTLASLTGGDPALPWMHADSVLSGVAADDVPARRLAIADAPFCILAGGGSPAELRASWFEHWAALQPRVAADEEAGLRLLVAGAQHYLAVNKQRGVSRTKRRDACATLDALATGLVHRRAEEPAAVFSYLSLVALDLQRLRDGLLRRTLFPEEPEEQAA